MALAQPASTAAATSPAHNGALARFRSFTIGLFAVSGLAHSVTAATALPAAPPAIRTGEENTVPACITPKRLDAFLARQNAARGRRLEQRFQGIAAWYQRHGKAFHVRWDYAFFQMALETNFLSFRRGDGRPGDVRATQNNFAGLGTTGGGVPGDSYPDVSTGVLAHIQHLVVYSGERIEEPVGHRTRLKQDVILRSTEKLAQRRPVTFLDLAGRWAADRRYGRSIQRIAKLFYVEFCNPKLQAPKPVPARRPVPRKS